MTGQRRREGRSSELDVDSTMISIVCETPNLKIGDAIRLRVFRGHVGGPKPDSPPEVEKASFFMC